MNKLKLGVVLEALELPARHALASAAKLGVHGVQVDAGGELSPDRLTDTGRRELRTLLRSYNLSLAAVNCPLRRGLDTAADLQPRVEWVRKVMQLAVDLGCRAVVAACPKVPYDAESPRAQTLREALLAIGPHGDRVGVTLALEVGFDPGAKVRDYLAGFDTGSLRITYDPANMLVNGHDPIANLAPLKGYVAHTHARDARTTSVSRGTEEVPVGAGDVEWMAYVATLEAIEYGGYLCVDRENGDDRAADVATGVKFLRRFVAPAH